MDAPRPVHRPDRPPVVIDDDLRAARQEPGFDGDDEPGRDGDAATEHSVAITADGPLILTARDPVAAAVPFRETASGGFRRNPGNRIVK